MIMRIKLIQPIQIPIRRMKTTKVDGRTTVKVTKTKIHSDDALDNDEESDSDSDEMRATIDWMREQEDKLYPGSNILVIQAVLMLMSLYVQFKLTKSFLKALLRFIDFILPRGHLFPTTTYKMFKLIGFSPKAEKQYYTRKKVSEDPKDKKHEFNFLGNIEPEGQNAHYFYTFDLTEQILHFINVRKMWSKFSPPKDNGNLIKDITDGSVYKIANSGRKLYDITLLPYTDGLSLSLSTKVHCYPVYAKICEITKWARNSFTLILGNIN